MALLHCVTPITVALLSITSRHRQHKDRYCTILPLLGCYSFLYQSLESREGEVTALLPVLQDTVQLSKTIVVTLLSHELYSATSTHPRTPRNVL